MLRVLVTGATGYIGGRLVPRLLERGHLVRCLARQPENLRGRAWNGVDIVQGDVLQFDSLRAAMRDIDVAYYLVHSMRAGEQGFEERDRLAARNFARAAREAGVKRLIYLGGLGSDERELSPHLQSRHEVGNLLRESGIPVTEFRAAIIVGSGSISFEMIRYLTERLPIMICPRWVQSLCQPIAVRDVLAYLVETLDRPESAGRIFEIGGPDVLPYRDMMLGYAKVRGLKRRLIQVPVLTPRLSSYWVDFVTPIPASISRPLIEGLKEDVVCHEDSALQVFSVRPIGYEEAVRLALGRINEGDIETIWSGSHASFKAGDPPASRLEKREGMILEVREAEIAAPAKRVFEIFSGIGGKRRWFYADWAWQFRGMLDRLVGGPGMRRGRRNPDHLIPGDALDFWRVEEVVDGRSIRLRAEMKVPGKAWLQFEVEPLAGDHSHFTQTAYFEPKGLPGLLYWYFLYPIHRLIFSGLCREIQRRGEA
ncbi:MAG: SDR family oxidoreductase [Deltaproteobacteria bacterium]|nr:SDR family oxidoreductase [Deltaproteobacteria bacterium]